MSQQYTVQELQGYAKLLDDVAEALPIEKAMTKTEAKQLMTLGQALGGAASNIRLMAVQQLLADTTEPLAGIVAATNTAKQALLTIAQVSKVITIVGDIVVLGQVIATQKWSLVLPALENLKKNAGTA